MTNQRYIDRAGQRSSDQEFAGGAAREIEYGADAEAASFADDLEYQVEQHRGDFSEPSIAQGIAAAAEDGANLPVEEKISTLRAHKHRARAFQSRNPGFFIGFFAIAAVGVLALMLFVIPNSLSNRGGSETDRGVAADQAGAEADDSWGATSVRIAIDPRPASLQVQDPAANPANAPRIRTVAVRPINEPSAKLDPSFYQPAPARDTADRDRAADERQRILSELRGEPATVPQSFALAGGSVAADENTAPAIARIGDDNALPRNPVRNVETMMNRAGVSVPAPAPATPLPAGSLANVTGEADQASQLAAAPAAITQPARGLVGQPQPRPAEANAPALVPAKPISGPSKKKPQWIERAFGFGHGR